MKPAIWTRVLSLLLLASVVVPAAKARIFSRRPMGGDMAGMLQTMGGRQVYAAPVRVNGVPGHLVVTGFDDVRGDVAGQIRAALQLPATPSGRDALHVIERDGITTRLLLLHPGEGGQMLAVTISQAPSDRRRHRPDGVIARGAVPVFPGATPGLQAENEDTGMQFVTMTSSAEPVRILAYYETSLSSAGWTPVFPGSGDSGLYFLRGDALCMVWVAPSEPVSGQSRITLIYKPLMREGT